MKNKSLKVLGILVLVSVLFTGCSKLPQAEIDAVNASIAEASTAGADIYLKDNYVALQDSMRVILADIEGKKSKLFKNYSAATDRLVNLNGMAQEVTKQTIIRKEELKNEILSMVAEAEKLVTINYNLILEAPKGKEGTTALLAIKGELSAIETTIQDTKGLVDQGEYLTAMDKIKAGQEKAQMINTELTDVITKYKSNVRNRK